LNLKKKNVLECYHSDNFAKYVFSINSIFNEIKPNYKDIFIFFNLKSKKKITITMKMSGPVYLRQGYWFYLYFCDFSTIFWKCNFSSSYYHSNWTNWETAISNFICQYISKWKVILRYTNIKIVLLYVFVAFFSSKYLLKYKMYFYLFSYICLQRLHQDK